MTLGPTFETTLTAARTGAEWAWASLYRDLTPNLLRYLKARGADDPENTMGEVFVLLVRKLHGFQGGESEFRAWLFTIARNRLVDEARSRQRRPTVRLPLDWVASSTGVDDRDIETSSAVPRHLKEVLDHLTPEQRDVLFLRVLAELTLEETAQVLGKTTGSVKRLQARGFKSLRQKIAAGVVSFS
jgi:RNA polymerase sigma-70 factor (ECF subfamily)